VLKTTPSRTERVERLRTLLKDSKIDGLMINDMSNIFYLTGFTGSSARVFVSGNKAKIYTDKRYEEQVVTETDSKVFAVDIGSGPQQELVLIADMKSCRNVGFESDSLSWTEARKYLELLHDRAVVPTVGIVEGLRTVKDDAEIERITTAATIADAALAAVKQELANKPTEAEFARLLDQTMFTQGANALSFETICASGPNSALPHARPSDRTIQTGDLVVLDFGAVIDGYHSDMSRTFCIGEPSSEAQLLLDAVAKAQDAGVVAVRPNVECAAIDAACRNKLADFGLQELFVHGTGHGVGLVIHEAPWVNSSNETKLQAGHVVTVEPGVYRPGFGGVRIEDTILVTQEGGRLLTLAPKDPVIA
jgi:Xaa-Pro aminopeptidase